jgi:hypothetical protein
MLKLTDLSADPEEYGTPNSKRRYFFTISARCDPAESGAVCKDCHKNFKIQRNDSYDTMSIRNGPVGVFMST